MFSQSERDRQVEAVLSRVSLPEGILIRAWCEADFQRVQELCSAEGWITPEQRPEEACTAWRHSWPALVAVNGEGLVVGFVRALSDTEITTYIADFLVAPSYRKRVIGRALLEVCHRLFPRTRLDLLSLDASVSFYEANEFRGFPGFRKSY